MQGFHRIADFRIVPLQPYDFGLTVRKPAGWHWFTPFEEWKDGVIRTGSWFTLGPGRKVPLGVRAGMTGREIRVDVYAERGLDREDTATVRRRMVKALGAEEDLRPLYRLMRKHGILKHLVRRLYGMREAWNYEIFPSLSLAVLLQMAPIKRSEEMWRCLIGKFGRKIRFDRASVLLWPSEEKIAGLTRRDLDPCRLGYRAKNLLRLSRQLLKGFPSADDLAALSGEEAREKLTGLFGIGEYSAGFASPHPSFTLDVWSVKIFHRLLFGKPAPKDDPRSAIGKTARRAERLWGDWRGYILTYVLNDLEFLEKKFGITAS